MIYTSYAANLKNIDRNIYNCISITNFNLGLRVYSVLCPTSDIVSRYKKNNNIKEYINSYNSLILNKLDIKQVYRDLIEYSSPKIPVLICLEKPDKFCHRMIIREWFNNYNYKCEELKLTIKPTKLIIKQHNIEDL